MAKKKVLILIAIPNFNFTDEKSAVLSFLISIREAFISNGYDVDFGGAGTVQQTRSKNDSTSGSGQSPVKKLLKSWKWLYHSLAYFRYFKGQTELLEKLMSGEPYDLIVEFYTTGSTVGIELARHFQCNLSVIYDSPVDEQFKEMHGTRSFFWNKILSAEKKTLEYAEKIMVYSPACEKHLRSKYDIRGTVSVVPSMLHKDTEVRKIESDSFNIGFIGSFLNWHKVDLLVEVFEEFYQRHKDARLYLIGYGQEWERIQDLVKDKKLEDFVVQPGFVSENELADLKGIFTIAIMPGSNWYGSPLKLFEYALADIPFISPVSKTVSHVFTENEHCLFVQQGNERKSLLEAMEKLYSDDNLRNTLAMNARKYVENDFNKEVYANRLINALDSGKDVPN